MLKPLLARPAREGRGTVISRADAPLLFDFIESIRTVVRAPAPREVRIDTHVNASASFRRGMLSLLRRDDLVLTIGVPLFVGLSLRQLGGVLAHELGHFAQGSSMRLTYLIRVVNGWLMRVAHDHDSWDEGLARAAKQWDWRISIVLRAAQLAVLTSRQVLAWLATAGHAIGTFMLREMELDADRYEAAVAGSDVFESTALRMRLLGVAREHALEVLGLAWREGRLCEDFPGLVVAMAERIPAELRAAVESAERREERGGIFDTHPPDRRRIASAKAEGAPGILRLDMPASVLIDASSTLARRASVAFYLDELKIRARDDLLHPVGELLTRVDEDAVESTAAERYFGAIFNLFTPLTVRRDRSGGTELAVALEALREAREAALRLRPDAPDPGQPVPTGRPGSGAVDPERLAAAQATARERLAAAVALLEISEVRSRLGNADSVTQEIDRLTAALAALAAEVAPLRKLAKEHDDIVDLFGLLAQRPDSPDVNAVVMESLGRLHVQAQKLEQRLVRAPYPFDHGRGPLSVAAFAAQGLPLVDGIGPDVHVRTRTFLHRLQGLFERMLARLAALAERVERAAEADAGSSGGIADGMPRSERQPK
jgi:hypothetical protein